MYVEPEVEAVLIERMGITANRNMVCGACRGTHVLGFVAMSSERIRQAKTESVKTSAYSSHSADSPKYATTYLLAEKSDHGCR